MDIHIITADWSERADALRSLRQAVLLDELRLPRELLEDPEDPAATHLIALNSAGQLVGSARLLRRSGTNGEWGELGRVAVVPEQRGQGTGAGLIKAALASAGAAHLPELRVDALSAAQGFYEHLGFRTHDHPFEVAGVRHVPMRHPLEIAFASPFDADTPRPIPSATNPPPAAQPVRRESSQTEFGSEATARQELLRVLESARRRVLIYSPTLDHALFDQESPVDAISALARRSATAEVQILICDASAIVSKGHALIDLARRLDDKISVRRTPEQLKTDEQSWLVVDDNGLWVQSEPEVYRGWADAYAPVHAQRLVTRFSRYWERSAPDPDLRLLKL